MQFRDLPAVTEDGVEIRLEANLEMPGRRARRRSSAAPRASACSDRSSCWPAAAPAALTEEAQYDAYRRLIEADRARAGDDPHVRRQRERSCGSARRRSRARGRRSACAASA